MRILRILHRWTGLVAGLFIVLMCLSGACILIGRMAGSYAPYFRIARELHTSLFIPSIGGKTAGTISLLLLFEIVSGIILWGKESAAMTRAARRRMASGLKSFIKSLSWKRGGWLRGTHVAGGFWSTIPLLLMILTGLTWCFAWYARIIYGLFDTPPSAGWSNNLFHTLVSLHTGSWGGTPTRILWFLTAATGAWLPVSGLLLYLRRNKTHRRIGGDRPS